MKRFWLLPALVAAMPAWDADVSPQPQTPVMASPSAQTGNVPAPPLAAGHGQGVVAAPVAPLPAGGAQTPSNPPGVAPDAGPTPATAGSGQPASASPVQTGNAPSSSANIAPPGGAMGGQPGGETQPRVGCCGRDGMHGNMGNSARESTGRPPAGNMDRGAAAMRDPTTMSPRFRDAMKQMVPPSSSSRGAGSASSLSKIRLAGKSIGVGRPASALIEFDKQVYLVRQGSQISLMGSSREQFTVRVESISEAGVQLLIMPLNERIFLN